MIPAIHANDLPMWTIYDHPLDYPDHFVARMYLIRRGQVLPTNLVKIAKDVDGLRGSLEAGGLTPLARQPDDDPAIVETWV